MKRDPFKALRFNEPIDEQKALRKKWRQRPAVIDIPAKKRRTVFVDAAHPKCPYCQNESTVFASGTKEWTCTRCHKVFDKHTVVGTRECSTLDHIYPIIEGQKVRRCYCGAKSYKVSSSSTSSTSTNLTGETTMAKTNKTVVIAKKSAKKTAAPVERTSNLAYSFVKVPADAAAEGTIQGCVLAGIRKIKHGSLDDVTDAATKAGLGKVSNQDLRNQTRVHLRRLANLGAVKITRNGEEKKGSTKATPAAKGKSFKLVGKGKK